MAYSYRITKLRPLIVPWSTCVVPIACVMYLVLASTRGPVRTTTQFLREWPEPCGSEQASGIIIDGLGTRWGGSANDHWTNSPSPGQHTATIRL